jgi:AhpD family alkylhydroperoxidase
MLRRVEPFAEAPILARRYYAPEGETSPIVRALAQVPELLPGTMPFLAAVLGPSSLDLRLKELVILRVSADAGCAYCIGAHRLAAHDAGVTEPESAALLGACPLVDVFAADEVAVLELADAVAAGGDVPERMLRPVRRSHGDHGLVELVLLAATTLMLNRFCTTLRLPLSGGARARLAGLPADAA